MTRYAFSLFLLLLCSGYRASAQIVTYPVPRELYYAMHNDDYTVTVRPLGSREWIDLYEYKIKVDMDTQSDASFVQFDFNGKVEVRVQKNNGDVRSVKIRPLSKGIKSELKGTVVKFVLDHPEDLSVEFNNDRLHNLHLFTNPIEKNRPHKGDKNVMYFEAGIHEPTNKDKDFRIPSNTTVYLEPGAFLKGGITCDSVENVKIIGRGYLLTPQEGVKISFSKNILIDGLTAIDPRHYTVFGGQSQNITIKHLRSFSYQGWSDGIDMMCCHKVLVDSVFMRNSDDCIAIYNHRWQYYGGTDNIEVRNSTLWADVAHPINIGGHGNPDAIPGETMENVWIHNVDILEEDEDDPPYEGCMAVDAGDRNLLKNIRFENIRVENIQEGCLFYLKVRFNDKYDKQPGRGIEDIVFKNIVYNGQNESLSVIKGFDETRKIKNVLFDNVLINGIKMKGFENFSKNDFLENVRFK